MPTTTTNYGLLKPLVNNATDQDLWGSQLNEDMDDIDTLIRQGITIETQASQVASFAVTASISVKYLYPCDATGGAITATLPAAATAGDGATVFIKKTDASAFAITIARTGGDTIDGAISQEITAQNDAYGLVSDGVSAWNSIIKPTVISDATTSIKGIVQLASAAEMEAATNSTKAVTPDIVKSHPGVAKAWVVFDSTGAITASHNVTSVTKNATGNYTINFTTAFSSVNYAPVGTNGYISGGGTTSLVWTVVETATTSCNVLSQISGGAATDPQRSYFVFYGDQ